MAAYGTARQGKWNSRGWVRLVFEAIRTHAAEGRGRAGRVKGDHPGALCGGTPGTPRTPYCHIVPRRRTSFCHIVIRRRAPRGGVQFWRVTWQPTVEEWFAEERELGVRVLSAARALAAYV